MSGAYQVLFFPKALHDLERLEPRFSRQILADVRLLEHFPWPPGKVKKLHALQLWELKTGDFRTLLVPQHNRVVVARVVNRRELEKAVRRIDPAVVLAWLRARPDPSR